MSDVNGCFKIKRAEPARPQGAVIINYDAENDILWVGRDCECAGRECIHAKGEVLIEADEDVVIAAYPEGDSCWNISSIALTHASRHPLWKNLFHGLESALRERKRLQFTVDPIGWRFE